MAKLTVLDNGMRVVTEAMPGRRIASVGFWTPAGSAHESRREAGVAHLLEHMLFKGTQRRSAFGIAAALDAVGGDLNAFTEREHSCVHCTLLGEDLPLALDLMSDMVFHSAIAPPQLRTERTVVLQEIADYEDNPEEVVHDEVMRLLWPTHPLGGPVHGSGRVVMRLQREDLLAYRDQWYAPGALVVAAAGNVSHEALVELVRRYGPPEGRPAPRARSRAPKCAHGSRTLRRDTEQVHLCLAVPAAGRRDPERYVDSVLAAVLGAAPSSRLFQQVRERRGLAYHVGASHMPCETAGILMLYAGTLPGKMRQVADLLYREVDRLCRGGVSARELERVKGFIVASIRMNQDSPVSEAQRLGHSLLHHGRVIEPEETIRRLTEVTAEAATDRARRLFTGGFWARALAGAVDEKTALPAA
jgi:predicted Zn-dependent peptidase